MEKKVLVVDDAMFMRMMLTDILTANGFAIAGEAENGAEAVAMFRECAPDVVLMDITMPEMDGIKAVQEIMGIDPGAKIIMCSAMGQQAMVIQSIQSGALDFVVKPFQPDRVVDAINKALS
jgi:two-component system chemotaxis response regulator CheY